MKYFKMLNQTFPNLFFCFMTFCFLYSVFIFVFCDSVPIDDRQNTKFKQFYRPNQNLKNVQTIDSDSIVLLGQSSSSPSVIETSSIVECHNNSLLQQDFGTACLKKTINQEESSKSYGATKTATKRIPGRIASTRYFSVKPMVIDVTEKGQNTFGIKSPVLNARELYASKGYPFPKNTLKTESNTYFNVNSILLKNKPSDLRPVKNSFQTNNNRQPELRNKFSNQFDTSKTTSNLPTKPTFSKEEDEWRLEENESIIPIPLVGNVPRNAQEVEESVSSTDASKTAPTSPLPLFPLFPSSASTQQPYADELEMIESLKRSLGTLCGQALNVKQRTALLYREARRRKLYFFDALLIRTYSFISEKLKETRNAIDDIDQAIDQIKRHQEVSTFKSLRRTYYYYNSSKSGGKSFKRNRLPTTDRTARMRKALDPRELDQLTMDALNHAKLMMRIIRDLNEALDEFEEQFNLPRFEPNRIDDNQVDFLKEDF